MVLLASSMVTRGGRAVVSRQFVDMSRARIEGLLAAFPKLIPKDGGQHTFIETESVRYVYQPIEKMYLVLITTKNSNILEDLETLLGGGGRKMPQKNFFQKFQKNFFLFLNFSTNPSPPCLFARVIPEYCRTQDEQDIADHAFELIFAFDEVVALGYRESVNLAQIRTFTEMDSNEERVAIAIRETQEKEAKQQMLARAKELEKERKERKKMGRGGSGAGGFSINNFSGGFGGAGSGDSGKPIDTPVATPAPQASSKPKRSGGKAMRLGGKNKNVDHFVDQLAAEGQHVVKKQAAASNKGDKGGSKAAQDQLKTKIPETAHEAIHIRLEEKILAMIEKDGAVQKFNVNGFVHLHVNDENCSKIRIQMANNDSRGANLQTHPNIDKKQWQASNLIAMKNPDKGFPVGMDVGVLKWRVQNQEEDSLPLTINCWPNETGSGSCDVNIEYELQSEELELQDVTISIPTPSGCGAPVVGDCDGSYNFDQRKNLLTWTLPIIDKSNSTGQMDFSMPSNPDDFFPVEVNFHSTKTLYTDISVQGIVDVSDNTPAKYSLETALLVDKYTIGEE